ncbi:efflux RND transporter periplasmic adaptor subunit [Hydrogenophaga sp. OTU3427]|uniref:efflux RND transporter periplasmic adaptor subunit n=1 Tax=Hydrogenophaga sp. OTU3427 TaxID=3043856 RepID=UPI00313E6C72
MANKVVVWLLAGAGLALASGGAWWLQKGAPSTATTDAATPAAGAGKGPTAAGGARPGAGVAGGVPGVEVARVKTLPLQDDAQAVGSLKSRQSVTLRPEVAGRVAEIAFADGARVRKGQLLLRLDDTLQKAELSQAEAQLSIARANLKRNQELVAENFVAQRVLDESRASLQVAEAQVALAQARLGRMRLLAPFDGTVGIRTVNLGDFVKDGADLVNLEDTSMLYVDFRMPERYQGQLAVGQGVKVQIDALPGRDFSAKVQALDPLVDANGRSVLVRAVMSPGGGVTLRPGMFARVTTVFSVNDAALVVPEEALVPQGGKQLVFKIASEGEGEAARTVVRRTEVQLGVRRGSQVQITRGLSEGDTVVVAGQQRLQRDGMAVRVIDMNKPPAAGGKPGAGKPAADAAPAAR